MLNQCQIGFDANQQGVLGLERQMDYMHILIHYKMRTDISVRMIDFFFPDDRILGLSHEIWCM